MGISLRRLVCCVVLGTVFSLPLSFNVARADDQNAYWERQAEITTQLEQGQTPYQGNPNNDNEYWERQAEIAAAQDRMPAPQPQP